MNLHDADDARLGKIAPVLLDLLNRLGPLLARLDLVRDHCNLDLGEGALKVGVEAERVALADLTTFGELGEDPVLAACKRLKRSLEVRYRNAR